jgi:tRNA threonylcarbamoyladenosine biosynthesis protein TsaB
LSLILSIETSSVVCSVCLSEGDVIIDFREDKNKNSHARVLTLLIDDLIKSNGKVYTDIEAVAVSAGPGSYTGLRIGVSAAKGLCYALGKPLIAVSTLLSLAEAIKIKAPLASYLMPVIDARRMDVYTAVFDNNGKEILPAEMATSDVTLEAKLKAIGDVTVGGDAMEKCRLVFTSERVNYVEGVTCDARLIAAIAYTKFQRKDFADLAYFEPLYVNEFVGKMPKGK